MPRKGFRVGQTCSCESDGCPGQGLSESRIPSSNTSFCVDVSRMRMVTMIYYGDCQTKDLLNGCHHGYAGLGGIHHVIAVCLSRRDNPRYTGHASGGACPVICTKKLDGMVKEQQTKLTWEGVGTRVMCLLPIPGYINMCWTIRSPCRDRPGCSKLHIVIYSVIIKMYNLHH
jgi:hypothetical protein